MKHLLTWAAAAALIAGCSSNGAADSLNNTVELDRQQKVYRELRVAMKQAGAEALAAYPKTGTPEGGAEEFRAMQDSLRITYWQLVCDTNQVARNYGDSIWTKGVKEKWPAVIK
jgi:uncharacterized lipoprotein YajG